MVDPIESHYFPRPSDDGGDSGGSDSSDPTYGAGDVPNLAMGWDSSDDLPSYNLNPAGAATPPAAGTPTGTPLNEQALVVNPLTMRNTERSMLAATDRGVEAYIALKAKVEAAISGGAIYGQIDTDEKWVDTTTVGAPPGQGYWMDVDSPLQGGAKEFAAKMDNYQRGALIGMAAVLDVAGAYIAGLNVAGTTYSYIDRQAKFPEPPAAP
ncbi:hypothetical protein [Actinoplanes sp. L3-i22]|uniref:hypothetical protein n=1 Tax=Actinoplanes sp. L3-i22 TaxID=2836373 RepID=UPI001C779A69|nr:hypothetical protein [Actinoplanes sp. L3-i22]BCY11908.1 hypothetical protein L3i22_069960 [Actinoplanes sp. L3-i22]